MKKLIKKTLLSICIIIILYLLTYFMIGFVNLSWNVFDWAKETRGWLLFVVIMCSIVTIPIISMFIDNE